MSIIQAYDAIHLNIGRLPPGAQVAGYTTGTSDIRWTGVDWANHPKAVRIDQDFAASDPSADVLDVERGAATPAECPGWAKQAWNDFNSIARSGQRTPTIYTSQSNLTNVANALVDGGVTSGVNLWVADWSLSMAEAASYIDNAGGPFPIVGVQFSNGLFYDYDLFDANWLAKVSGAHVINPVSSLQVIRRGYTSMDLAWKTQNGATGYTVKTYWRGSLVERQDTAATSIRVRNLKPLHTYEFTVRAHPSNSQGTNATIKATTR